MSTAKNDFLTAILTIVGSIGAAVIVSKREQKITLENTKLREQLIVARLLSLLGVGFGIGSILW